MSDHIIDQLEKLEAALLKDAEDAGEDPANMRKSKFASEMERKSFIEVYGQKAYDNLKD